MRMDDFMNDKLLTGVDENLEWELPKKNKGDSVRFSPEMLEKKNTK